jgi:hypothetical protein
MSSFCLNLHGLLSVNQLEKLETKIYTLATAPKPESLTGSIVGKIELKYQLAEVFTAPQLPLNLLANAYKNWLKPDENEIVVALIDTSLWDDARKGIAFTDKRIIWKGTLQDSNSLSYSALAKILNSQGLELIGDEESRNDLENLHSIASLFPNEDDKNQFSHFVQQLSKDYLALESQKQIA